MSTGRLGAGDTAIQPTIFDAKGDLIVATAADTPARLAVGSNNQTLLADSAQSTGVKWGSSPQSLMTATGDLLYASAANTPARLGIGSTSQVLTVSGGVPTWATPAVGGTNWSLVSTAATTSGSTVTVSSISGADKLLVIFRSVSTNSTGSFLKLRINSATTNYSSTYNEYGWQSAYNAANFENYWANASDGIPLATMPATATATMSGHVLITGGNSSGLKVYQWVGGATPSGSNGQYHNMGGGYYTDTNTISSVSIIAGNTFDGGAIEVYKSA